MSALHAEQPRTLRIGIDAHAIGERKTGNERFISNLIRALRDICDHELFLYFTRRESAAAWRSLARTRVRVMSPRQPLVRIPISLPYMAARDRLDVLMVQYTAPPLLPCPVVTVVHDVAFSVYPQFFSRWERTWMGRTIPWTMRRAASILTVSHFSRDEITRVFGIAPHRIAVCYDAVDPIFTDPSERPSPVRPPFFLYAGNIQPRKNVSTLIRGYRRMIESHPEVEERLVIVGQPGQAAEAVREEARALPSPERVVFLGYVTDDDLVGLLQRATAFAYPSVYEGFGLPVVEAMAAGVPVVVSDIPVMREVTADAALRLPSTDVDAWATALADLALDPSLRRSLSDGGKDRAATFTWEGCARAVLRALEKAANGRGTRTASGTET